jgi:hypothetical protein
MIVVPIRTVGGLNARECWQARARRVKKERKAVAWALVGHRRPEFPCRVLLTRLAPSQGLDDDNLRGALKGARDEVAKWLGVDDRHSHLVSYQYAQCRSAWGVQINFEEPK